ncbi:hypothetical protein F7Q99_30300 [Streptomyces kaniharaensis]|uniref:Uncharacterized protein n=1 Tax=Streptomyces kaniharaensis TaxID=212423 RepID=A0A6N7KY04_9ACTN|nr:hypothetical protein [Streptomyces kaniharaensis]
MQDGGGEADGMQGGGPARVHAVCLPDVPQGVMPPLQLQQHLLDRGVGGVGPGVGHGAASSRPSGPGWSVSPGPSGSGEVPDRPGPSAPSCGAPSFVRCGPGITG